MFPEQPLRQVTICSPLGSIFTPETYYAIAITIMFKNGLRVHFLQSRLQFLLKQLSHLRFLGVIMGCIVIAIVWTITGVDAPNSTMHPIIMRIVHAIVHA